MLRAVAPIVQRVTKANTDFVGLVDAWGAGFIDELDYTKEARATDEFAAAMEARGLGSVTSPKVSRPAATKLAMPSVLNPTLALMSRCRCAHMANLAGDRRVLLDACADDRVGGRRAPRRIGR